jgi:hypothetical protein
VDGNRIGGCPDGIVTASRDRKVEEGRRERKEGRKEGRSDQRRLRE